MGIRPLKGKGLNNRRPDWKIKRKETCGKAEELGNLSSDLESVGSGGDRKRKINNIITQATVVPPSLGFGSFFFNGVICIHSH